MKETLFTKQEVFFNKGKTVFISGKSPKMKSITDIVSKAAPTNTNILITGESGTGKEVLAKIVHENSLVKEGPFWPINIGGVPENLLESELFGYEKGAFTGANSRKQGLFEIASGGSLFLDEIGDMPMQLQVKLLRVLQEKKIQRVGGTSPIPIAFRLIAATNKNLEEEVREGRFREDLFYRLNVIHFKLPPLRERKEEIPELVTYLLTKLQKKIGLPTISISPDAMDQLLSYSFPGNIRELENILERSAILCENHQIKTTDLNINTASTTSQTKPTKGTLKEIEKDAILKALLRNENHRIKAANELGISRRTLLNKIKEYDLHID